MKWSTCYKDVFPWRLWHFEELYNFVLICSDCSVEFRINAILFFKHCPFFSFLELLQEYETKKLLSAMRMWNKMTRPYFLQFSWTCISSYICMHLADAFIQSDLHCIQVTVSTFYQLLLSLGIEPMILALLTPCSTSWATGKLLYNTGCRLVNTTFVSFFLQPKQLTVAIDFHNSSIVFFPIMCKSMATDNIWLPTFFKISSFVFNRRKKLIHVWNK